MTTKKNTDKKPIVLPADDPAYMLSWESEKLEVPLTRVRDALALAGFDKKYAKELHLADAFRRSAKKVSAGDGIIEQIKDDSFKKEGVWMFQFTKRGLDTFDDHATLTYAAGCFISLVPETGTVDVTLAPAMQQLPDAGTQKDILTKRVKDELDNAMEKRYAADINALVHVLALKEAHTLCGVSDEERLKCRLFSVKQRGGVYIVSKRFDKFLDGLAVLFKHLGVTMKLMDFANTPRNQRELAGMVEEEVSGLLESAKYKISQWKPSVRPSTMEKHQQSLLDLQNELACYSIFLGSKKDELDAQLLDVQTQVRFKLELATKKQQEEVTDLLGDDLLEEDASTTPVPSAEEPKLELQLVGADMGADLTE